MINMPLVSIIIPTYNRAHLIGATLDSVLAQTYPFWECIVIDDGSTDTTSELLQKYTAKDSRIQYHHRPKDRFPGGNAARNYGFELSKGDYIQWFDSDDLMLNCLLEIQIENIRLKESVASVCLLDRYDEEFNTLLKSGQKHEVEISIYSDFVLRKLKVHLPTTLFKREVVDSIKFDEYLNKSQEVLFIHRAFKDHQNRVSLLNKVLVKVRRHRKSITGTYTEDALQSVLKVKWTLINEFPETEPSEVLNKLKLIYLENLKYALKNLYGKLYFKYLLVFKGVPRWEKILLFLVYPMYKFLGKGSLYYDYIINGSLLKEQSQK